MSSVTLRQQALYHILATPDSVIIEDEGRRRRAVTPYSVAITFTTTFKIAVNASSLIEVSKFKKHV